MNDRKMHKLILAAFAATTLLFAGCSSTTVITKKSYNADGTIASEEVTETKESAIVILAERGMKNNLAVKQGGWYGNVGVNSQTQTYGFNVGAIDNSLIMSQDSEPGVNFAAAVPAAWDAQKYSIAVTKDGIVSEGDATGDSTTATATSTTVGNEQTTNTASSATAQTAAQ